jgi:N-acetyl sugar amidotransferase
MTEVEDRWVRRSGERIFAPSTRYRVCTQCIMDTSDPEIEFDESGVCNHCHDYARRVEAEVYPGIVGRQELAKFVAQIKRDGAGKKYDCILGLSGGVDSTYVAYVTKQLGLRPLAVHLDNGWNSEISVRNIENIVKILDIDLYTEVLDWEEFRRLQVAFLKASTPDSEIPTDHAIIATLYKLAAKHGIRWIMDGSNIVTEIMVPATWSHGHSDWGYIEHLNNNFGGAELKTYPHYDYYDYMVRFPHRQRIQRFPLLNYIDFNKLEAIEVMKRELKWTPYGGKHYESIYTRFYQGYILPKKFGFDKRRSHLSCLVNNGRITRDEALREIQKPALSEEMEREDREFVRKKLGLSEADFEAIMTAPRKTFWDYPSSERDLPGTKQYRNYIWQANFFGGDFLKSDISKAGYYAKYYANRYAYFAKWWIHRIAYFAWAYTKRYSYFAWYYIKRIFYYAWAYTKRAAYFAGAYTKRFFYYAGYYAKRAAYFGGHYAKRLIHYAGYYAQRAASLGVRAARVALSIPVRAARFGYHSARTIARYAWRGITRPDRAFARLAGLLGFAR